jgi:glycine/D-amino acid oxidase-like deaminating enzyme
MHVLVVGGGIFGVTAARALVARGLAVTLVDPAVPEPHPLAESTDISKIVRIDYGSDEDYTRLGEAALEGWRTWEAAHLFHETGVAFLSRGPLAGFERDSYELLTRRGHPLQRLDATQITRRFPAYRPGALVDGYFNPLGGWAEATAVVATLARPLTIRHASVARIVDEGVLLADDDTLLPADLVIVCAGSWVPLLVPELVVSLRATGQPVFHLRPADPAPFAAHHFPVFGADISRTGFYGFPATADGIVKIANHGSGTPLAPGDDAGRVVSPAQEAALRELVAETFPALATAPIVDRRLCAYCDTADGDFWIARHPSRANLVVATGGSGHAFKFAPVLGDLIADIALGIAHPLAAKFAWRAGPAAAGAKEAARHAGS